MMTTTTTTKISLIVFVIHSLTFPSFAEPASLITDVFRVLEQSRITGQIHRYSNLLYEILSSCELEETRSASNAGFCAIIRTEAIQSVAPPLQRKELEKISVNLKTFNAGPINQEEKLFIEMRLFAYLPTAYGRQIAKSLIALESLKRLYPQIPHLEFYEREIRFLQGRQIENGDLTREEKENVLALHSFGWLASVQFLTGFGIHGHVGYRDDKLNDGPWGAFGYVEGATRPMVGAVGGVAYSDADSKLGTVAAYRVGTEYFYGLGPKTDLADLQEFRVQRFDLTPGYRYWLSDLLSVEVGLRVRDVVITSPLAMHYSLTGPTVKIVLDELDQISSPRFGHRLTMHGHFHRFQEFGLEGRVAFPLGAATYLNGGGYLEEQFGTVEILSHLKLGENVQIPGVPYGRYQDRTLMGAWIEGRRDLWGAMGGGAFGSIHFLGHSIDDAFRHRSLVGVGAFADWRWTRYPKSDARIELSRFNGETLIQIGVAQAL